MCQCIFRYKILPTTIQFPNFDSLNKLPYPTFQESSEKDTSEADQIGEPLVTNESHNPILEANLEKVLDAEEMNLNNQQNYIGAKSLDRKYNDVWRKTGPGVSDNELHVAWSCARNLVVALLHIICRYEIGEVSASPRRAPLICRWRSDTF